MKNTQRGSITITLLILAIIILTVGGVYIFMRKDVVVTQEVVTTQDDIKLSATTSTPVSIVAKAVWGSCIPATSTKRSYSFNQMKATYGGYVSSNSFNLSFSDNAQVRLRDGILTSLCGADLDQVNSIIRSAKFVVSRIDSVSEEQLDQWAKTSNHNLNSDYLIVIPKDSNIDKEKQSIEDMYGLKIVERVDLSPIPSTP